MPDTAMNIQVELTDMTDIPLKVEPSNYVTHSRDEALILLRVVKDDHVQFGHIRVNGVDTWHLIRVCNTEFTTASIHVDENVIV